MGRLTHQTAKIESHSDYRPCVTSLSYIYIYIYIYFFFFVISLFPKGTGMVAQKEK